MGWYGVAVTLAFVGLSIPNTISYVAPEPPPTPTIEEKILAELPPVFIEIAKAESGMKETAYNPEWHYDRYGRRVCQGSYGLFQVACVNYEGDPTDLYDVDLNIEVAKVVFNYQGYRAWGVCVKNMVSCPEQVSARF